MKKKMIRVCVHCCEPRWHKAGCLTYLVKVSEAREVRLNETTFLEVAAPREG